MIYSERNFDLPHHKQGEEAVTRSLTVLLVGEWRRSQGACRSRWGWTLFLRLSLGTSAGTLWNCERHPVEAG